MITKHYICDVCDCSEIFDMEDFNLRGWSSLDVFGKQMELCPVCTEKLKKVVEKFIEGES